MRLAEHIDDPVFRRDGTNSVGTPAWSIPTYDICSWQWGKKYIG